MNNEIQTAAAALAKKHGAKCIEAMRSLCPDNDHPATMPWLLLQQPTNVLLEAALLAAREDERERCAKMVVALLEWIRNNPNDPLITGVVTGLIDAILNPPALEDMLKPDPNATKKFIQDMQAAQKATREHSIHFGEEQTNADT